MNQITPNEKYRIIGGDLQALEVTLEPGESVRAETGSMLYLDAGIEVNTNMEGGLFKGVKRMLMGEGLFITTFTNTSSMPAKLAFAAPYPGVLIPINLADIGGEYTCQRDSYLCSLGDVDVEIAFTKKIGAGLFGGEGFILQKLSGSGLAFVHIGGTLIEKKLAPGEVLRVDTGCLAGFTKDVQYDIQFMGGFKNSLFGGEGLFYAVLTGPGTVHLQSLPFARIADRIHAAASGSASSGGEVKRLGSIVGNLLNGR